MYVTTHCKDGTNPEEFVRLNNSHGSAWNMALTQAESICDPRYREIDYNEGEGDDPSIVRIINNHCGYEYHAFIIRDVPVEN